MGCNLLKKVVFGVITFILSFILLSICVVGFSGNAKGWSNVKGGYGKVPQFSVTPSDMIFDSKNGGGPTVKVLITQTSKIEEMSIEEYVRGVVCAEMEASFELEALKAQAIAARTFALAHMSANGGRKCSKGNGADLCNTVHCQVFRYKDEALNSWSGAERGKYWNKITDAVQQTAGQVITYDNKLVMEPYFFAISSGKTEDGVDAFNTDAPYLKSVSSPEDKSIPNFETKTSFSYADFINSINKEYPKAKLTASKLKSQFSILKRTKANYVAEIQLGSEKVKGQDFRFLLGLKSANFKIEFDDKKKSVSITCNGYGHDVGMSQWGANLMAKAGKKYSDILEHYYSGVKVEKMDWNETALK